MWGNNTSHLQPKCKNLTSGDPAASWSIISWLCSSSNTHLCFEEIYLSLKVKRIVADTHTQPAEEYWIAATCNSDSIHLSFICKASVCRTKKQSNEILTRKRRIKGKTKQMCSKITQYNVGDCCAQIYCWKKSILTDRLWILDKIQNTRK